ncbi:RraA family protein [Cucumibacter marinus]|uniref:RraA family protein n=1 Tax=Cucumibacter marinus TaxID=1121252 RepID=UPI000419D281|nr:RraA family protein [Cucumibacter marinus]
MTQSETIFDTIRQRLTTAQIGDALDVAGFTRQFLPPYLRAVGTPDILVGRALTVLETDIAPGDENGEPFGLMFRALDDLRPGEIYLCTGSSPSYALWGELMSSRAQELGAAGAVVDGFHRDTAGILRRQFPVFSAGAYAQDQRPRGRVEDFRCDLTFANGVKVADGDIVVADVDGVLVVPADALEATVAAALEKAGVERDVQEMIESGQSTSDIFNKTGVM